MKVTEVPAQIAPAGEAAIETLAGRAVFTAIVMTFDVAGEPVTHESVEVMTTEIASPLASVVEV